MRAKNILEHDAMIIIVSIVYCAV